MSIRTKRIVYTSLSAIIILSIFAFSSQSADKSEELSDGLLKTIINSLFFLNSAQAEFLEKFARTLIRKSAHFTEFLALTLSLYLTFSVWLEALPAKLYACALSGCLTTGVFDELSQLLSDGRAAQITDVAIDFSGGIGAVILIMIIRKIKFKAVVKKV